MLENSTKDHRFLVLLIASKDPSKNAYGALRTIESVRDHAIYIVGRISLAEAQEGSRQ